MSNTSENRLARKLGIIQDKYPLEAFYEHPCESTLARIGKKQQNEEIAWLAVENEIKDKSSSILKHVSKKFLTRDLCLLAVTKNGNNLKYVPENLRDFSMCFTAVSNAPNTTHSFACVLDYVPKNVLLGEGGHEIYKAAVSANSLALSHVPKEYITKEMAYSAVENSYPGEYKTSKRGEQFFFESSDWPIGHIPDNLMTQELVNHSLASFPASLSCIPLKWVSEELCLEVVKRNGLHLKYVPQKYREHKVIIEAALANSPQALQYVPKEKRTKKRCFDAIKRDPGLPMDLFPDNVQTEFIEMTGQTTETQIINANPVALDIPTISSQNLMMVEECEHLLVHELAQTEDSSTNTIYYISDIHLEHQLDLHAKNREEVEKAIENKVAELVSTVPPGQKTLLVGGDIANNVELETMFYKALQYRWSGKIISILGNHELWDGHCMGTKNPRSIDEIINDYRQIPYSTLLENDLLITHKMRQSVIINEKTLLEADDAELIELCEQSSFIILGGVGFSGLNPRFNAAEGIYRSTVSMEEDIKRTERFRAVYEKVLSCAATRNVVVLTHNPMSDWSGATYNPNWIYINGHTHQNSLIRKDDGTAVFSDNQIGYKPRLWNLKGFTSKNCYDPFEKWTEGIHPVTRQQYIDFNHGHGIAMADFKQPGEVFVLKRDGIYMFILQDKRTYLLEGGQKHILEKDTTYYYENLTRYQLQVQNAVASYQSALRMISKEVKAFGGSGTIHGCIVDIDYFNHIYLNPFDGKITPYFAWNTTEKYMFPDVPALLNSQPAPLFQITMSNEDKTLLERYETALGDGRLPILAKQSATKNMTLAVVPEIVLDKSMYKPSRIMRSFQYIFDQNVIRIWNDIILETKFEKAPAVMDNSSTHLLQEQNT